MASLSVRVMGALLIVSMLLFPAAAAAAPETSGQTIHIVQWGETLSMIADRYGVTVEAIMAANGLHDPNFVYVGQRLKIPTSGGSGSGGTHVVAPGETLTSIAFRYGTTVGALAAANGLSDTDFIYVGQVLNVPGKGPSGPVKPRPGCASYYTVQWGDTLSGIAWRHRTKANALMQANGLYSDLIYEGQRLCVPPGGVAYHPPVAPPDHHPPAEHYTYHTVQPGETLATIAWHYGVSQSLILQANNLPNASYIYPGQRLIIPGAYKPAPDTYPVSTDGAPAAPPEYTPPGIYEPPPASAPEYQPPEVSKGPVVVPYEPQWTGSQTANNPDPDEITTLIVMTHEKEGVDVMIREKSGFVARATTGVYYEFSWIPTFAFRYIPGGEYEVWVEGEPSKVIKAKVDPGHRALVELKFRPVSKGHVVSPAGWTGEVVDNTSGTEPIGAFSILVVRTGAIGNKIRVTAPGGYEAICVTGTKPEHGPGACDVGGLNAGTYQVILDGADIAVELYLDGIGTAVVEFRPA